MNMDTAPRRRRSPWTRYAPVVAVAAIVAIVAVALATRGGDGDVKVTGEDARRASGVPVFYDDAKADGDVDKYTWQDHCNRETGTVAIPVLNPPPCVPKFTGDNGGATSRGVTADTIRIGYYISKPDPITDTLLRLAGGYDTPENTERAYKSYAGIYSNVYELYGRKVEMVKIQGTGGLSDAVAARADAAKAVAAKVFAVIGGPAQARQFGDELAKNGVLCIGACIVAQPQKYYLDHSPYMWPSGPSPDQTSTMVTELIDKQLLGKPAEWAGPELKGKERTFTLLTYNTPDGQFTPSWDDLKQKMKAIGADVIEHVDYYLNLASLQADARTIAAKLKQANATSILFTGDPIFPRYLTAEMTNQGYFPEWVMSGTVFADTNVFGRTFDQQQWQHAFGLQLIPARVPQVKQDPYTLHQWWYGTPPPTENNYGIVKGDLELLFNGLQLAGPKLTPESFEAGIYAMPPAVSGEAPTIRTITTRGDHGFWPGLPEDPAGLDNAGVMWWDPNAEGADETGAVGKGMYRLVDGGRRYLAGRWPTEPIRLFDPAGTVTIYDEDEIPPELLPAAIARPPDAPAAQGR